MSTRGSTGVVVSVLFWPVPGVGVRLARVMHLKRLCSKLYKPMDLYATCGAGMSEDLDLIL